MSVGVLERPATESTPEPTTGGVPARRAMLRWAWRLFRREWRQQLMILLLVSVAVRGKPRRLAAGGALGSGCRGRAHSVVTSVTAARAEVSSTMALPAAKAASREERARLLTARG